MYKDLEVQLRDVIATVAIDAGARLVEAGPRDVWYGDESPLQGYGRHELPAVQVVVSPETAATVQEQHTAGRVMATIPFVVLVLLTAGREAEARAQALTIRHAIEQQINTRRRTTYGDLGANTRVVDRLEGNLRVWPEDGNVCVAVADIRGSIARMLEA